MKSHLWLLFSLFTLYSIVLRAQNSDVSFVNLETYYGGQYYPYLCSQKCKNEYEKYHKCFHIVDNDHYNDTWTEYCEVFKINECKTFLQDIYLTEGVCTHGNGPEDFEIHDEINMNRAIYLSACSRDKDDNLCEYSEDIQRENYYMTNLFHMDENVKHILANSCSKGICRENLRHVMEILLPLYEHDIEVDIENEHESKFVDSSRSAIEYLSSEQCTSQDIYVIEQINLNNDNESSAIKISFSLITMLIISFISIFAL